MVSGLEETQEQTGFLSDSDICQTQEQVISILNKISQQEKARDKIVIQRQAQSEAEEAFELYDQLATLVNEYFGLRIELIRIEAEVYEFGRILHQMGSVRANKFKAALWNAWHSMQTLVKQFLVIQVTQATVDAFCEKIDGRSGLMQISIEMDDLKESI